MPRQRFDLRTPLAKTLGLGLGLLALTALVVLVQNAGCTSTTTGSDLGTVESGCRAPSACYTLACSCDRDDVLPSSPDAKPACRVCDPLKEICNCMTGSRCVEPVNVCVGRKPEICPGVGARCLPKGSTCATSGGTPPNLVGDSDGGELTPHCPFVDDFCCPGSNPDGG